MTVTDIVRAASAFQDAISDSYWEEHGISDEEAATGMLAAMQALGFCDGVSAAKIQSVWKRHKRREERKRAIEAQKRWAAMTPQEQEVERQMMASMASLNKMMTDRILDSVFQTSPLMNMLKSPNAENYT